MLVHGTLAPGCGLEEMLFAQNTWAQGSQVGFGLQPGPKPDMSLGAVTSPGLCFLMDVRDPLGTCHTVLPPTIQTQLQAHASRRVGCSGLLHF